MECWSFSSGDDTIIRKFAALTLDAVRRSGQVPIIRNAGREPQQVTRQTDWGFPMDTGLLVIIMSFVALNVAALVGGGLGLGIMRLLGRGPTSASGAEARDSIH